MVSHFDEKAAELVGFSSVSGAGYGGQAWHGGEISFTCAGMLIFEQSQIRVKLGGGNQQLASK